jgi:hypothetical protein
LTHEFFQRNIATNLPLIRKVGQHLFIDCAAKKNKNALTADSPKVNFANTAASKIKTINGWYLQLLLMNWITIYVRGKEGFELEVLRHLQKSDISFLPGSDHVEGIGLYWVNEATPIRDFKKAIGAKTIFKYRLDFFFELDKNRERRSATRFTPKEAALVKKMSEWQLAHNRELSTIS